MVRRHAVIAGSGRSGTTFLVEYLSACGVPTYPITELGYYPEARAGLEQNLLDPDAGYLVKDPWLFDYVDEINFDDIALDAVIIPVRDLRAAATSRVVQERSYRYVKGTLDRFRTMFGDTPAGVLNPIDVAEQEKHLAVSQSRLFSWCLGNDLPAFMLQYPRLITDGEYLVSALWPWLQNFTTRDNALSVFKELSMPNLRIDDLVSSPHQDEEKQNLRIEVEALSRALHILREQSRHTIDELQQRISEHKRQLQDLSDHQLRSTEENELLSRQLVIVSEQTERKDVKMQNLTRRLEMAHGHVKAIESSRTWRIGRLITGPLRLLSQAVRRQG
jgi:hypothetical protein